MEIKGSHERCAFQLVGSIVVKFGRDNRLISFQFFVVVAILVRSVSNTVYQINQFTLLHISQRDYGNHN